MSYGILYHSIASKIFVLVVGCLINFKMQRLLVNVAILCSKITWFWDPDSIMMMNDITSIFLMLVDVQTSSDSNAWLEGHFHWMLQHYIYKTSPSYWHPKRTTLWVKIFVYFELQYIEPAASGNGPSHPKLNNSTKEKDK